MKLLSTLLALGALVQDGMAFSVQKGPAFRTRSSLSMTVEEKVEKRIVNVGVIGCGRIGIVHLEAITKAPGVKAIIVSNPTVSKAEKGKKI
jgi:ornithine cyclodeaminase/alanine dehydrogenase-like protein (mu-crystallin family)